MFRLVSLDLNGIRSAAAKGFQAWAEGVGADCIGVQGYSGLLATPAVATPALREFIYEQRFNDHAPLVVDDDFKL